MTSRDQSLVFMDHIRSHASRYYPVLVSEKFGVQLLSKQERPSAMLYRFKVGSETQIRSVFVKVPLRLSGNSPKKRSTFEKPQLFPKTESRDMHWLHYTALKTIYNYFTSLDKEQLGAIRVLDYLPQYHAIFTEESSDPKLRNLFFGENRLLFPFGQARLSPAYQNVGVWLRLYHAMPKEQDVKVRSQHRNDYIEVITTITDFLTKMLGSESFFKETASILIDKARETLPDSLPLGLGHGDYAMRNILVGPNFRVTTLDTFAKWRMPIYEDIGYFLNDLKMSSLQVMSHGLAFNLNQLATYEQAFLKGYFGQESIPYPAIRLYEALALLDKWSSKIARSSQKPNFIKIVGRPNIKLVNQYFKQRVMSLLAELTEN
ncbi:MAG: hypothetical protein JJE09_03180 [Bacteroidia bacterium]|nr:hypothetical protein [Bacteroidia bacterium]